MALIRVQEADFDSGEELARLTAGRKDIGGVAMFIGKVRDFSADGTVGELTLEHYPGMTEKELQRIVEAAGQRWCLLDTVVIHRVGRLRPADNIVLVAVASVHRGEAFAACEFIMDYLKTQAPFWKRESTGAASHWVEARRTDADAAGRWNTHRPPVIGFAGWSGSGKTTLLERLIPILVKRGYRVGVIKQSHHRVELDTPGKDSYRLRKAGAARTLLGSPSGWALLSDEESEPSLESMLERLHGNHLNLVLVEGFRDAAIDKIEIVREPVGKPPLYKNDEHIIALATDAGPPVVTELPLLDLNAPEQVADFIIGRIKQNQE